MLNIDDLNDGDKAATDPRIRDARERFQATRPDDVTIDLALWEREIEP